MAYQGTTSTSPNFPELVLQTLTGPGQWRYTSTHISSDIEEPDFFADGATLGMKVGDTLMHVGSTAYVITSHAVISVGTSGVTVSTGSTIGI